MENGLSFAAFETTPKAASKKRHRVALSETQSSQLERLFAECKYPDYSNIEVLSRTINMPYRKILVWFKNRRAKDKRSRKVSYGPHDFALDDRMAAVASVAMAASPPATPSFPSYSSTTQHQNQQLLNMQLHHHQCYSQQQYHHSHLYHYCSPTVVSPQNHPQQQQQQQPLHHQYPHLQLVVSPQTPDLVAPGRHQAGYLSGFAREDVIGVSPSSSTAAPIVSCSPQQSTQWGSALQTLVPQVSQQPQQSGQYQHHSYHPHSLQQQQQHHSQRCLSFEFMPGGTGSTPMMQSRML